MLGVTANVHVRFIMYVRRNRSTGPSFGDARPMARAGSWWWYRTACPSYTFHCFKEKT